MFLKQYRMFWEIAVEYVASFVPFKCLSQLSHVPVEKNNRRDVHQVHTTNQIPAGGCPLYLLNYTILRSSPVSRVSKLRLRELS